MIDVADAFEGALERALALHREGQTHAAALCCREAWRPGVDAALLRVLARRGDAGIEIAVVLHAAGAFDLAIVACEHALARDPRCAIAYGALAWLLPNSGRAAALPRLYARWREHLPDDAMAVHMHAATSGRALDRAAPEYVAALFDEFAPTFDRALDELGYAAPAAVAEGLEGRVGTCLDAGCGTGLVGVRVRERVDVLVGVDLSAVMIERARARGIYDALHTGEIVEHLRMHEYDAVLAADVLVYVGDLQPFADATARALRPGGTVIVTTELSDDPGQSYALRPTGRFVHAVDAAAAAFARAGLRGIETRTITLRLEQHATVLGVITRARR